MSSISHLLERWKTEQARRHEMVRVEPLAPIPRFVAGADGAFSADKKWIYVVALVWDREEKQAVEIARVREPLSVPYVPGFLSFREGPAVLKAVRQLKHPFGALCIDGQGLAHPRRCGIACHVGVELDVPTVGIAKSVLVGEFKDPKKQAGSTSPLVHKDETVGWALRTCDGVRPVFLSVGHRIDLPTARDLAMACVVRCRLPEPTRQADIEVAKYKSQQSAVGGRP
jgi:deoxyribonuclease V